MIHSCMLKRGKISTFVLMSGVAGGGLRLMHATMSGGSDTYLCIHSTVPVYLCMQLHRILERGGKRKEEEEED